MVLADGVEPPYAHPQCAVLPLDYASAIGRSCRGRTDLVLLMRENPFPAEAERWSREHDSNVRARACDLRFKGGSVRPLPHPGKVEPRIGFEPMSSRLKGEHPGPLDERGGMERAARLELALSAWKADAQPICQAREVAESAGVEPARPEGLVALAPRCLAARPTLRIW